MENPALRKLEEQKERLTDMAENLKKYKDIDPQLSLELTQLYNEITARIRLINTDYSFYR